jgi:flagellin-like hook-associated protein FlgL
MQEVIRIAQECKDLLTQIQSHLSESETKQIADDIIMVLGAAA